VLRPIEEKLFPGGNKQPVIVIYGPRQAGKTTLVRQLLEKYPKRAKYMNCDYNETRKTFAYERSGQFGGIVNDLNLLVLDEAQRIENVGLVLKILVDEHPNVQVVATGSSSFDLGNKINESLTGRKWEFHLLPLSYEELCGGEYALARHCHLERMLRFGGYPAVALLGDHDAGDMLREITGGYLFKDIFTFQHLRKPELLDKLLRLLAFQVGNEVSYHELAQKLGVDQTVIQNYIFLLEETFVIFRLGAFRRNLRTEIGKRRKIYFWDLGVRNMLISNMNPLNQRNDIGALWENFCIAERLKFLGNHHERFPFTAFWRTYRQQEIDYIEEEEGTLSAFECQWNAQKKRSCPSAFRKAYPGSTWEAVTPENVHSFLGL